MNVLITLTGQDQTGIVAAVSQALYQKNISLGETSMLRLGGNFTIMMAVQTELSLPQIKNILEPVSQQLGLSLHIDPLLNTTASQEPNCHIRVYGADRPGIIAQLTQKLAELQFNILDLESAPTSSDPPAYILYLNGYSPVPLDRIRDQLRPLMEQGIQIDLDDQPTLIG